ncbi:hypothetical protein Nmel_003059 [Mimus melanotis]
MCPNSHWLTSSGSWAGAVSPQGRAEVTSNGQGYLCPTRTCCLGRTAVTALCPECLISSLTQRVCFNALNPQFKSRLQIPGVELEASTESSRLVVCDSARVMPCAAKARQSNA